MDDIRDGMPPESMGRARRILRYFTHGQKFIEEILRENELLRYRNLHLEQELEDLARCAGGAGDAVQGGAEGMRGRLDSIRSHFEVLKRENEDFRRRQTEVEKQNENLLNLYVTSYQLHSTFDQDNVTRVIKEILLNLLGAEIFALWVVEQETGELERLLFVDEHDLFSGQAPEPPGHLVAEMVTGLRFVAEEPAPAADPRSPLAAIPIQMDGRTIGMLAVYKLFVQKSGLTELDYELFDLLTSQAAAALLGAQAFSHQTAGLRILPPASAP